MLSHPFAPVFDEYSEILILGSFPSVKSRENAFYYGHPQNRFWKVLEAVFAGEGNYAACEVNSAACPGNYIASSGNSTAREGNSAACPANTAAGPGNYIVCEGNSDFSLHLASISEKKAFLLQHHIALWDVIASCEIKGSADVTITNATPNDIASLLKKAPIRKIYCNGNKAWELFQKYILPTLSDISSHTDNPKISITKLPSTSPANAAWSLEKLVAAWKKELSDADL